MQRQIAELARQIREFANDSGQRIMYESVSDDSSVLEQWIALSLAMDTLDDATEALIYWEESELGDAVGERLIKIYGMFQAIVLQQQAIRKLHEVFVGETIQAAADSGWTKITEVYDMAIASPLESWQPTDQRGQLSQIAIDSEGYYISIWDCRIFDQGVGEAEPEQIYPYRLLDAYTAESVAYLGAICATIPATD